MPSTYSPDLRIELIANGEQSGTWGATTNSNLGTIIEDAISGLASVVVTTANQALTAQNGAVDQARCSAVDLTTSTTANFAVYVPPVTKLYVVKNSSAYTATVYCSTVLGNTTAAGSGVAIPAGKSVLLRSDGTNIVEQLNHVVGNLGVGGSTTLNGTLAVTGASTLSGATTFGSTVTLNANPTLALQAATKQYVDSSIPTGVIVMWSGSIGTIPSGWALCNGTGGTPDLRDRFIVGAGNTYAVAATGGSADATLVSHTHTASTDAAGLHNHGWTGQAGDGWPDGPGDRIVAGDPNSYVRYTQVLNAGSHTHTVTVGSAGSSGTNANLPPYYALAYIMKL